MLSRLPEGVNLSCVTCVALKRLCTEGILCDVDYLSLCSEVFLWPLYTCLPKGLKVTPTEIGTSKIRLVVLPSDIFLHYLRVLDSLTGFANVLSRQTRINKAQASDLLEQEAKRNLERYSLRIVKAYIVPAQQCYQIAENTLNMSENLKRIPENQEIFW